MYYIVYGLFWLISLLPLRVLYVISDGIYGIMFYVVKYRRNVVMQNLARAFPEKTEQERIKIAKKFYHNLIDTFIETIKMITASRAYLAKRFTGNWEVFRDLEGPGKSVQFHLGHTFNWEWANAVIPGNIGVPFLVVYMPVASKIFERLFCNLRSRHGTVLLRATKMAADFMPYRHSRYLMALASDQNPGNPAGSWWFRFLNQPTPFLKGPARNAVYHDTAVVFGHFRKTGRGRYEAVLTLVEKNASRLTEAELTGQFVSYLEAVIRQYPDMWLWSHRRWKHRWEEKYGPVRDPL